MTRSRLATCERETIITTDDAQRDVVHVFTESKSRLATRLLKVAWALGVEVTPAGEGFEFELPVRTLSVRIPRPPSAKQQTALRLGTVACQRARYVAAAQVDPGSPAPPGGGAASDLQPPMPISQRPA